MTKFIVLAGLALAAFGVASTANAQTVNAKAAYDASCKKCHGVDGVPSKAITARYPKIEAFNAAFFEKRSNDSVVAVVTNGKTKGMPAYKAKMTPAEIAAVSKYIRTFATKSK